MGFMLNEVFAQAVSQINSWLYRSRKKDRTCRATCAPSS